METYVPIAVGFGLLVGFALAIILLWFGLIETDEAAWTRYSQWMLTHGLRPERTPEWEQQRARERLLALSGGVVLLVVLIAVAFVQGSRLL